MDAPRYWFAFLSAYRGESDYTATDRQTRQARRVHLRWSLDNLDRSSFSPIGLIEAESGLGILRGSAADNSGELPAELVAEFNAHYGETAVAGRWSQGQGWQRKEGENQ